MKSFLNGLIERTLEKKVSAIGLGLFRIFFGMVILHEIGFLLYFRHLIFDPLPYIETAGPLVTASLLFWFGVVVCLIAGLNTLFCSIANYLFWVVFVLLTPMWRDFDGGFDQLMAGSSFILIFVRSERRLSLDSLRLKWKTIAESGKLLAPPRTPAIYYTILLGVSLGFLYFDAALHKLHSEIWMNGLGAWVPNTMPYYMSPFDFDRFVNNRGLQEIIGYSLIAFQLAFLFVFSVAWFRIPLLIIGVLFHLGIIFCLNIYPFGFGMLVHYILLVPLSWWTFMARTIEYESPRLRTYCNLSDRRSTRRAVFLQHFDFRNYSSYQFISSANDLPDILRKEYANVGRFALISLDPENLVYEGCEGFKAKFGFRLLLLLYALIEHTGAVLGRIKTTGRSLFARLPEYPWSQRISQPESSNRPAWVESDVSATLIHRFLFVVLVLQVNSTVYYGLSKRFNLTEGQTVLGQMIGEVSTYVTSISHVLLGITPHALYMDDHFSGYEQIVAFNYIDRDGTERLVPFIARDGRFVSPNWGRVHSMWANVAMHPPFNPVVFERLAKKVTAFWAEKLGIGTENSTFLIKSKPVQISYRWIKDLRKRNLLDNWSDFAEIHWIQGNFSIDYHSGTVR
ncbi:MAG: DCC1-like thiol-disulfide oxidoreductase family protein [Gammaproteobacteria bacterium]